MAAAGTVTGSASKVTNGAGAVDLLTLADGTTGNTGPAVGASKANGATSAHDWDAFIANLSAASLPTQ